MDELERLGRMTGLQVVNDLAGTVTGNVVQAQVIKELTFATPPPAAAVPRQIPPAQSRFVNRRREWQLISRLLDVAPHRDRLPVVVLSGMGGVGKTAMAVHWAQSHRDRFPGGQLYADLANYRSRGVVDIADVLASFLRSLGVQDHYIPVSLGERAALFRTKTAEHATLVMLDDVDSPAQVRGLLPGSSASMVLVTSRQRLSGLLIDGAELVELGPLDHVDSSHLVELMVPAERLTRDPEALRNLLTLCAGLPIALRVAGARLAQRREWSVAKLVEDLSDAGQRLHKLSVAGESRVNRVFDVAYGALAPSAQDIYRVAGVHPGPDFGIDVLSEVMTGADDPIDDVLDGLREANLVEEIGPDRYRLHDLVRLHAQHQAREQRVTAEIIERIVCWYLLGAAAADWEILGPKRWRLAEHDLTRWKIAFTPASAMEWFETERLNLLAAVRAAAEYQWYPIVWQFCEALWSFYYSTKYYSEWIEVHELGVRAAGALQEHVVEARMRNQLSRAFIEQHEFVKAVEQLDHAEAAANTADDAQVGSTIQESWGVLYRERGDYPTAAERFQRARALNAQLKNQRGIALQTYQLGDVLVRAGEPESALAELVSAVRMFTELEDGMSAARVFIVMGSAYSALGRSDDARAVLTAAVQATRQRRQYVKEAQALELLARVAGEDHALFDAAARRLLFLYEDGGSARAAIMRQWLEQGRPSDDTIGT
jgi:tetratricopeptide (TPR) repeat protein